MRTKTVAKKFAIDILRFSNCNGFSVTTGANEKWIAQGGQLINGTNKSIKLDRLERGENFVNSCARGRFKQWKKNLVRSKASLLKVERQIKSGNSTVK